MWFFGKKKKKAKNQQEEKVEQVVKEEKIAEPEIEEPVLEEEVLEVQDIEEEAEKVELPEIYEIRVHKDGGWQVIKKGASRARKRFRIQSECITFCRENNLKHEVYKKDGTLK